MDSKLYERLSDELTKSSQVFLDEGSDLSEDVQEDILVVMNSPDLSEWTTNIDGVISNFETLLNDLHSSNNVEDVKKCVESIAMLRGAIYDISSGYSNLLGSMDRLLIAIRDD